MPKDQCAPPAEDGKKGAVFRARIWIAGKGLVDVAYDDLCKRCSEAVNNYFEKINNVKPETGDKEKPPEDAKPPAPKLPKDPDKKPPTISPIRPLGKSGARS